MRRVVTGEQLAQLYNPDPFAMPRWRAPVYRTPLGIIMAVKVFKLLAWIARLTFRHPLAASVLALVAVIWLDLGWVALVALVLAAVVMLAAWRGSILAVARAKYRPALYDDERARARPSSAQPRPADSGTVVRMGTQGSRR